MDAGEKIFEDYCKRSGIPCRKLPTANTNTPDYELNGPQHPFWYAEVKTIIDNSHEKEIERRLSKPGVTVIWDAHMNHKHIRNAFDKDAWKQLQIAKNKKVPGIFVLCDLRNVFVARWGHFPIIEALWGRSPLHVPINMDGHRTSAKAEYVATGHRRLFDKKRGTRCSGLLDLTEYTRHGKYVSRFFHNPFAAQPIAHKALWVTEEYDRIPPDYYGRI